MGGCSGFRPLSSFFFFLFKEYAHFHVSFSDLKVEGSFISFTDLSLKGKVSALLTAHLSARAGLQCQVK